jgi:alkylation response protein AidB-like acyl-CoA dehydrogenase
MTISTTQAGVGEIDTITQEIPFTEFLEGFKKTIKNAFYKNGDFDDLSIHRGLPPQVLSEIMSYNPLSICIPIQYGGRGAPIHENLAIMAAASYESLALSLTLSINYALFIHPVVKYGQEDVKAPIFKRFLHHQNMGGLMITEPGHGSDALNMQTFYTEQNGTYHIQGKKHWGGLTGMANYWLLTARKFADEGLRRDIDFFICDVNTPGQEIVVEEYFKNLGLYQIPYGRNLIDVRVPELQRLEPKTSGIQMMLDILHRSRVQFPGMGIGFIKRMLDEAIRHSRQRMVGNKPLSSYDQVQHRLAKLQANYTICSALCTIGSELADLSHDLGPLGLEANILKSITTDMMQESSQSLLQLVGAKGYQLNHIAGRSTVDSRPFQIFEGSNDILYVQISDTVLKLMTAAKECNFLKFLKGFHLSERAAGYLKKLLDFNIEKILSQRKLVELGQVISHVAAMDCVLRVSDRGFRPDLINGALNMLEQEITTLISAYSFTQKTLVVEGYEENSQWLDFVKSVRQ